MKTPAFKETSAGVRGTPLLNRARSLGLDAQSLENLAISRGCDYYRVTDMRAGPTISLLEFSNEELAVSLLSPFLPATARSIRIAAALVAGEDVEAEKTAKLAKEEGSADALRYIAECGSRYEPANPFWSTLLESLPQTDFHSGKYPHPTRFIEMTGIDRKSVGLRTQWIRPRRKAVA